LTERKALTVDLKADQEGAFRATFATLNVIDKDLDVVRPGAFKKSPVRVAQFGHNWGAYIIGDGTIDSDDKKAWADAEFYLDTSNGLDTYRSVKRASAAGLQEWSWGFDVVKYSFGKFEERDVRFLDEVIVHEVSPVMLGAGVDTRTEFIKSAGLTLASRSEQLFADTQELIRHAHAAVSMRAKEGRVLSDANRELLKSTADAIATALEEIRSLLASTERDDPAKSALQQLHAEFIATTQRLAY